MCNDPGELFHPLLNWKTLQSCKFLLSHPIFNTSLESTQVPISQNRFTLAFEVGLFGAFGSYMSFSEKQGTLPKGFHVLVAFHPMT